MNIGNAIKTVRTLRGMTLSVVADRASLSASYVSLIEKGQRHPNLDVISTIAAALEVPVAILLFLSADPNDLEGIDETTRDAFSKSILSIIQESK